MTTPPKRITIREIASVAKVSVATVSAALSGTGRVAEATRAHVEEVARTLGYRANLNARALRSGRGESLTLLLPKDAALPRDNELLGIEYYVELASAAARAAFEQDYGLLLLPALRADEDLRGLTIDGAIVVDPVAGDHTLRTFDQMHIPTVTVDRDLARPDDTWWVSADNTVSTRLVLDHLAASGARRIALLTTRTPWSWFDDTTRAYVDWVSDHAAVPMIAEISLQGLERGAAEATIAFLDRPDPPDAIFAPPDRCALAALNAARDRGVRVPDDLMIAAGIDSREVRTSRPAITAIDVKPATHGIAAVNLLIARINDLPVEHPVVLDAELCVRESTALRRSR